jgi:hypothetical protein
MTITQAERLEILEEIARDPRNRAAQIAAIRALRESRSDFASPMIASHPQTVHD